MGAHEPASARRRECSRRFEQRLFQVLANARNTDAVDDVARERVNQKIARVRLADAARAQVEHRFFVELADGRAVRAAHIVGQNLQLGLGVDHRIFGKHQVLVGLLGVGLLRVLAHENLAVEHGARCAVQNAFVELVAGGVRLGMVERRVIIDVLRAVGEIKPVQRAFAAGRQNSHSRRCAPARRRARCYAI